MLIFIVLYDRTLFSIFVPPVDSAKKTKNEKTESAFGHSFCCFKGRHTYIRPSLVFQLSARCFNFQNAEAIIAVNSWGGVIVTGPLMSFFLAVNRLQ